MAKILSTLQARLNRGMIYLQMAAKIPSIGWQYLQDCVNFIRHSATFGARSQRRLRARITEAFHNVEKGLSLPHPRPGFGSEKIIRLIELCHRHIDLYGSKERVLYCARDSLIAYQAFNLSQEYVNKGIDDAINGLVARLNKPGQNHEAGGTRVITKDEILVATNAVDADFFLKRYSVRQYTSESVDLDLIDRAIEMALKSPAVCNRQYSRCIVIADPALINKVLDMQGGARGFGDVVNRLIVVTNSVSHYWESGERNQPWIDGGMFSMSLLLGLHSLALGACCLNWSKNAEQTIAMKEVLKLDNDEFIIMMIAVGHLPHEFKVAYSDRIDVGSSRRQIVDNGKVLEASGNG